MEFRTFVSLGVATSSELLFWGVATIAIQPIPVQFSFSLLLSCAKLLVLGVVALHPYPSDKAHGPAVLALSL